MATKFPVDLLRVQIFTIPDDNFVLGLSLLGFETLGGSGLDPDWRNIVCDANNVTIRRGGDVDGATTKLDTGTVAITLVNSANPIQDPGILPAIPLRVQALRSNGLWSTIFTGDVEDVVVRYDKKGNAFTTLMAVDGTRELRNAMRKGDHIPTTNGLGSKVSEGTFYEAVQRISPLPTVWTPALPPVADRTSSVIGTVAPTVANTTRWGTNPSGVTPAAIVAFGGGVTVQDNTVSNSTTVAFTEFRRGVQTTITGLTVGHTYFVDASAFHLPVASSNNIFMEAAIYAMGVVIGGTTQWGPIVEPVKPQIGSGGGSSTGPTQLYVSFKATATSHVIRVARAFNGPVTGTTASTTYRPESFDLRNIQIRRTSTGGRYLPVQDINYESNLYNQIAMLAASSDIDWFLNVAGNLSLQPSEHLPSYVPLLSDDESDPNHICYTDLEISYDTKNIVNTLQIENHGTKVNPEDAYARTINRNTERGWLVRDTTDWFEDATSVGRYKTREDKVDLRVAPWALTQRATEILARTVNPQMSVRSVTINAMEHQDVALWELFQPLRLKFKNFDQNYKIVGIQHAVKKDSWFITFNLRRY